jgi:ParB/RepB/Spo0J family partition protein
MTTEVNQRHRITMIGINQLTSSEVNARKNFDTSSIIELATSIEKDGLIQPLTVRKLDDVDFEIIAGERRFRACRLINTKNKEIMKEIPCIIREYTDEEAEAVQLAENIHRKDLTPMEECEAYNKLFKVHKTVLRVSEIAGKSENYVASRMQLATLHKDLQKFLKDGTLPLAQAMLLAKLPGELQKNLRDDFHAMTIFSGELKNIVSLKELQRRIDERYVVHLNSAVFDLKDEKLDTKAGACTKCKFNTGLNKSLFEDVTDESKCMKGSCFNTKLWKHIKNRVKQLDASGEKYVLLFERDYDYGGAKAETVEGLKAYSSFDYKISVKKSPDSILGIFLKTYYNSKLHIGQEVYLTEKPKNEKVESSTPSRKTAPPEESPIEQRERRMMKRFEKEDELDKVEVRKSICSKIVGEKLISISILKEAAGEIIFNVKRNNLSVFRAYRIEIPGRENEETASLESWNVDDKLIKELTDQINSIDDFMQLVKCVITCAHLDIVNKTAVNITDSKQDRLIQIAKEYKIDIPALHKPLVEARKKEREAELADLEAAKKRAKDREKKEKPEVKETPKTETKGKSKSNPKRGGKK